MYKGLGCCITLLISFLLSGSPGIAGAIAISAAQEESSAAAGGKESAGIYSVSGEFDLGLRLADAGGNENKYFEDLNYRTGPRLFNLNFDVSSGRSQIINLVSVYAHGLGDPYQSFGVTLKKFQSFVFRYRRRQSDYSYRDILLPPNSAVADISNGGDYHSFNFTRTEDAFDLRFNLSPKLELFSAFHRYTRSGESDTTLGVSRDTFELTRPLDQEKKEYTAGFQIVLNRITVYFDQAFREFRDEGRTFLPGFSPGEDSLDESTLSSFELNLPFSYAMPQTTVKVDFRPFRRLTVSIGNIYNHLDGKFDFSEEALGTSFIGVPLQESSAGGGAVNQTNNLFDVDIVYDTTEWLSLIGGARFHRFNQDAVLRCRAGPCSQSEFETGETLRTDYGMDSDIYEIGARLYPDPGIQVSAGLRFEERSVRILRGADKDECRDTERTTFFISGKAGVSRKWNVVGEYERGSYHNPYTHVSPNAVNRFKARLRLHPFKGLDITGVVQLRRKNNEADRISLVEAYNFDSDDYSAHIRYRRGRAVVHSSFTRRERRGSVVNAIDALPSSEFVFPIEYFSGINSFMGGFGWDFTETLRGGMDMSLYENNGTFPLHRREYLFFVDLSLRAGHLIRLSYQRNSYEEDRFDFDDYDSDLLTMSIGYRF